MGGNLQQQFYLLCIVDGLGRILRRDLHARGRFSVSQRLQSGQAWANPWSSCFVAGHLELAAVAVLL